MKIIHAPHKTLRQKAQKVTKIDNQLKTFIGDLKKTLQPGKKTIGEGLAAPQVNKSIQVLAANLYKNDDSAGEIEICINPQIIAKSKEKTFGEDDQGRPMLEGCLSIPGLYGPVPRFVWIEVEYQTIQDNELKTQYQTLYESNARVMQHEMDHLHGILFTDYILEFDLPLYEMKGKRLQKINSSVAKEF